MTKLFSFTAMVGVLLLALGAVCPAQTSSAQHLSLLGAGDTVSVLVFGQPDVTNLYVDDAGMINVPLAGNVQVANMSPVEAAARVAKALKDGGYFVDPHVTISVTQQHSQLVSVVGEVQTAGRYPISPRTTIVDLLAQAGGLKETASDVGYIVHTDEDGRASRYAVKLTGLGDAGDVSPAPTLLGGDSLVIPRAEHVFVQGEVASPGSYPITPGMTVIQAIAHAGGITERGSERRIQVKRLGKNGEYQVVHAKPSDPIHADDMIRVKESIF